MVETLNFPLNTTKLSEYLPHRAPAVWIDEVSQVNDMGGNCLTLIKDAPYMSEGKVRPSSLIEFIAQSYGFVSACQMILGINKINRKPSQTFLVGFKELKFSENKGEIIIGHLIRTEVKKTHQLGPISLVEGRVYSHLNDCLLSGQIKIFAQ